MLMLGDQAVGSLDAQNAIVVSREFFAWQLWVPVNGVRTMLSTNMSYPNQEKGQSYDHLYPTKALLGILNENRLEIVEIKADGP